MKIAKILVILFLLVQKQKICEFVPPNVRILYSWSGIHGLEPIGPGPKFLKNRTTSDRKKLVAGKIVKLENFELGSFKLERTI